MARISNTPVFRDPARATQNLERLRPRLGAIPERTLQTLLAQLPDADDSLNLFERFTESAPADVRSYLSAHKAALHYLLAVFSYSAFLSETLLNDPALIVRLHQDPSLFRVKLREEILAEYRQRVDAGESPTLAGLKRREYLRIMLRDVLELATLSEVTLDLSATADAAVEVALEMAIRQMQGRGSAPDSSFTVLSMGKLGGNELNYSSDIDLLFLYRDEGGEFYRELAGRITALLTASSAEGRVFRVDLRLRPEGSQGEAAHTLSQALDYYRHRAREWELQALVKARHTAGDALLAREFLQEVQPLVYRSGKESEEAAPAALESVLFARRGMDAELRRRRSRALDVKLSPGGIRDIEFLVQALQRLHGGDDPWLRSSSTLFALQKLQDKGWLSAHDHGSLSRAYHFLRVVEHRLQLDRDQQTHRLPESKEQLDLVARRSGVRGPAGEAGSKLMAELSRFMKQVEEIYSRVLRGARSSPKKAAPVQPLHVGTARTAAHGGRGDQALERFLTAADARRDCVAALQESPELVDRAAVLFEASPYLGEFLIRSPEDVEALRVPPAAHVSSGLSLELALEYASPASPTLPIDAVFEHAATSGAPLGDKMTVLRRHYRRSLLRIQARSILQAEPIFETLEATSRLAEQAIRAALRSVAGPEHHSFTVVALGRLGIREFDLASDADLAFFFSPEAALDPEENAHWIRVAEKFITVLASHTTEGALFAVDTRLRPRGREGELVETARFVEEYFHFRAEPWEAITYMKSRAVAGDIERGTALLTEVQDRIGARFGRGPEAAAELLDMRGRLEATSTPGNFLKVAAGGYYDIDFVLTFLRLREAQVFYHSLNSLERLNVVESAGQIRREQAEVLREGAIFLRALQHALRLETGRTDTEMPAAPAAAAACLRLAERWFPARLRGRPLDETVEDVMRRVRAVFLEVFKA